MVDNSKGADAQFASQLERALRDAGFDVELRPPSPSALFDTSVHFVVEGVAVRVPADAQAEQLRAVSSAVRDVESQRTARQRFRSVPLYRGETSRVLAWVDVFDT